MKTWRLLIFGSIWLVGTGAAVFAPGCYGRTCDGDLVRFGSGPGEGRMIGSNMWESNGMNEKWLPFPPKRTYELDIPALGGRVPDGPLALVSISEDPNSQGLGFTSGAGNLSVFSFARPNGINLRNDTCADYFVRIVLVVRDLPPGSPVDAGDAGIPADDPSADAPMNDVGLSDASRED